MTSIGIWNVGVDVPIAYRRRRNHAIVLCGRRNRLFIVTARWILALGDGFFACARRESRRDSKVGTVADNRQDQSQDDYCADAAFKHLLSPTVLLLKNPVSADMVPDKAEGTSGRKINSQDNFAATLPRPFRGRGEI
jgi:hypothetical protein